MDTTFVFNPEYEDMLAQRQPDRPDRRDFDRRDFDRRDFDRRDRRLPTTPPPRYTPRRPSFRNRYPLSRCLYGNTYIWLNDGRSFWARLTNVTRFRVEGYRWDRRGWRYFTVGTGEINNYICV